MPNLFLEVLWPTPLGKRQFGRIPPEKSDNHIRFFELNWQLQEITPFAGEMPIQIRKPTVLATWTQFSYLMKLVH